MHKFYHEHYHDVDIKRIWIIFFLLLVIGLVWYKLHPVLTKMNILKLLMTIIRNKRYFKDHIWKFSLNRKKIVISICRNVEKMLLRLSSEKNIVINIYRKLILWRLSSGFFLNKTEKLPHLLCIYI
jgi:hypothetical protein